MHILPSSYQVGGTFYSSVRSLRGSLIGQTLCTAGPPVGELSGLALGPILRLAHFGARAFKFRERLPRIAGLQIDTAHRVFEHDDFEALSQCIERRVLDTVVGSETANEQPRDAAIAQQLGKRNTLGIDRLEGGVTVRVLLRTFGDNDRVLSKSKVVVKLGPVGALDTVWRPLPALRIEMRRPRRGPAAGRNHRGSGTIKLGNQPVEHRNDLISAAHAQRAAWAEIVLQIDNDQGILRHRKSL